MPVGDVLEADSKTGELKRVATYVDGRRIVTKTAHYKRNRNRKGEELKKSEEMFLAATTVEKTPDSFWNVTLAEYESQGKDLHHGPSKMWFESGKLQVEGFYQQDKRSGTFTYWYANGQVAATGEFADDLPNDVWVWWHENGQKAAVGKYRAGALVDEWRWWSEDGKLAHRKDLQRHRSHRRPIRRKCSSSVGLPRTEQGRRRSPDERRAVAVRLSLTATDVQTTNQHPRPRRSQRSAGFLFYLARIMHQEPWTKSYRPATCTVSPSGSGK